MKEILVMWVLFFVFFLTIECNVNIILTILAIYVEGCQ